MGVVGSSSENVGMEGKGFIWPKSGSEDEICTVRTDFDQVEGEKWWKRSLGKPVAITTHAKKNLCYPLESSKVR